MFQIFTHKSMVYVLIFIKKEYYPLKYMCLFI